MDAELRSRSYASACTIIRRDDLLAIIFGRGRVRFDLSRLSPVYESLPITPEMISRLREHLERALDLRFTREMLTDAIMQVAHEDEFHPVAEYLEGLRWDRVERIAQLPVCLGAEDTPLNRAMLRKFLIAAAARILLPGCKVDSILVLVGPQGARKSWFLSILGGDHFCDTPVQIGDKDGLLALHAAWIHEWAELDTYRRARDQQAVKAFLTSKTDTFRAPYERAPRQYPRRCVIAATTNDEQFLSDATGNRRYWVLKVGSLIDVEAVQADRDQIWAEAVAAFKAGERWHLDAAEEDDLRSVQVEHEVSDPWEPTVRQVCAARTEITVPEILSALDFPVGQQTKAHEMRVAAILKRNGFDRRRVSRGGARPWVYTRADASAPTLSLVSLSQPSQPCPDLNREVGT
jgi:putative DNA primase/helicase